MPYQIGHSAYTGANRLAFAASKTNAETILRERNITRDAARKLLSDAANGSHVTTQTKDGAIVECIMVDSIPYEGERARTNIAPPVQMTPD